MYRYILGAFLSVVFCACGIYLGIVQPDGSVDKSMYPIIYMMGGFLLSVISILVADRLEAVSFLREQVGQIDEQIVGSFSKITVMRRFEKAETAIDQIINQLPRAKECWNTRLSPLPVGRDHNISNKYEDAVLASIKKGLIYNDLVSENHRAYVQKFETASSASKGRYLAKTVSVSIPMINFIVIHFGGDEYDMYFGWPISANSGVERNVFLTRDKRVIDYFVEYHRIIKGHG